MQINTRLTVLTAAACLAVSVLRGQSIQYPVASIDTSLLRKANEVVRLDATEITVKDPQNATAHYHEVYTVLNPKADRSLIFSAHNSKFMALSDATIRVFNKEGLQIQKYGKKDLHTSGYGEELIEDGSFTYFKVSAPAYPITVEFDYTIKFKGILQYPSFVIQGQNQSVEHSTFQITIPNNLGFRYKACNTTLTPQINKGALLSTYRWEAKNKPAIILETASGPKFQYLPVILMAADHFSMDDYPGQMDTWAHFGDWVMLLNKKDAALNPDQIAQYQSMTAAAPTPEAKARILYAYMQQNMRYVSIQLGIGGWKPLAASFVGTKKYGDCKALSHFMQASLAAVGIESFPALINMGRPDIAVTADFPINCFNHEVLCIPHLTSDKDTTWLECTSQLLDFGSLGYETAGRQALLLTPTGGKLVQSPPSTDLQNILNTTQQIELHADGSASQHAQFTGLGAYKDLFLYNFYQQQKRDKKDFIHDYLGFKQTDSVQIKENPKNAGPYKFALELHYDQYPDFSSGNKLFVSSRPFSRFIYTPEEDSTRKADYYFPFPYRIHDTTIFLLDAAISPESIPENKNEKYGFGHYSSNYSYDSSTRKLTIISQLDIKQDIIKASAFKELTLFASKVAEDIEEKIVFIKQ